MMTVSSKRPELVQLVSQFSPRSLLAVGPAGEDFFSDYLRQCAACELTQVPPQQALDTLRADARYDLGLVSHSLEHMPKAQAGQLVARLRDIHCRRLLIVVPMGTAWEQHVSHWTPSDMLAYGFVRISEYARNEGAVHVYAFDIDTYKIVPDWLNSRYWAHPELFDKYWW